MSVPSSPLTGSIPLGAVLDLVAMQLEVAMQHAAAQAERLSGSIAEFSAIGERMRARLDVDHDPALATEISALEAEAHRAMNAMQFHDQLAQRVRHVREALADVHDELRAGGNPDWGALLSRMRAHYTMEDERRLFDSVLGDLAKLPRLPEQPRGAVRRDEDLMPGSVELF
jgi:hypothetical protein